MAGISSKVCEAGTSSLVVGVCKAGVTSTVGTDTPRMVGDRKADASGKAIEQKGRSFSVHGDRSLDSSQVCINLVCTWVFMEKFMRKIHDECVGICDRWLLFGKLVCMSMSRARYFCVPSFVNVIVHAAIMNEIKLRIT